MRKTTITKLAVAAALLFAVNIEADAQFGKLKNLAKKAKEAVVDNSGTGNPISEAVDEATGNDSESNASQTVDREWYRKNSTPEGYENFCVKEDGWQKYLGMTEGDYALIWKYYDKYGKNYTSPDPSIAEIGKTAGSRLAKRIVSIRRMISIADYKVDKKIALRDMTVDHYTISSFYYEHSTADYSGKHKTRAGMEEDIDACLELNHGHYNKSIVKKVVPMKQEDMAVFRRALAQVKAEYEAVYGPVPMPE